MKLFFKKFLVIVGIILATSATTNLITPQPTYAECRESFAGLTPWDCDLQEWGNENNLKMNIWIIVTNVSNDLVIVAAFLVLGYTIYGGYLYMMSSGDAGKTASGKKTLTHAFIGLAIVMSAKVIVNSIHIALLGSSGAFSGTCVSEGSCIDPGVLITNTIQWVIGVAGIVSVIFIVVGAVNYIMASGDASKLQKAKNTIMYALIGLAIVGLAEIITAFISSTIRDANKNASIKNETIISKEISK